MKKMTYTYPKSSFLSVEKDMDIIVNMILKNDRLKKLLYYTTKDCLERPNLTEDESLELFGKNIKIVPKIRVNNEILNYLFIRFDDFSPNDLNPEFRNNIIEFDIICAESQWNLSDFQLRPYKIAAELDAMFSNKRLTGIGEVDFIGAEQISLNDDNCYGLCIKYLAIHGEEDKKYSLNPDDDEDIIENFNRIFNNN